MFALSIRFTHEPFGPITIFRPLEVARDGKSCQDPAGHADGASVETSKGGCAD